MANKYQRCNVQILNITCDDEKLVNTYGLTRDIDNEDWQKERINWKALSNSIIDEFDRYDLLPQRIQTKTHGKVKLGTFSVCDSADNNCQSDSLSNYIHNCMNFTIMNSEYDILPKQIPLIFIINTMSFLLNSMKLSSIIEGICNFILENENYNNDNVKIVLLLRQAALIKTGNELIPVYERMIDSEDIITYITLIDYETRFIIEYKNEDVCNQYQIQNQSFFRDALEPTYSSVKKELITKANTYIGHYAIKYNDGIHSHFRTHYDIRRFLQKDFVREYIYNEILEYLNSEKNCVLICSGMQRDAYDAFAYLLKAQYAFTGINVIIKDNQVHLPANIAAINNADMVLIITDIVNSGKEVERVYLKVCDICNDIDCRILSLISMQNSCKALINNGREQIIDNIIIIPFDSYNLTTQECELCKLEQPLIEIEKYEDFRLHEEQLTPLDFWEMVNLSKSFRKQDDVFYNKKENINFRVDTKDIISNYHALLEIMISNRLLQYNMSDYDMIITTDEEEGFNFARILYGLHGKNIYKLSYSCNPTNYETFVNKRVLFVDDGINSGESMRKSVLEIEENNIDVIGAIVFDCRLRNEELANLSKELFGNEGKIATLYNWPVKAG